MSEEDYDLELATIRAYLGTPDEVREDWLEWRSYTPILGLGRLGAPSSWVLNFLDPDDHPIVFHGKTHISDFDKIIKWCKDHHG